jgi:hypothetical protein
MQRPLLVLVDEPLKQMNLSPGRVEGIPFFSSVLKKASGKMR